MAMNPGKSSKYGQAVDVTASAPHKMDTGTPENGLSSMEKFTAPSNGDNNDELARYAAGSRNVSIPGGYKLVQ